MAKSTFERDLAGELGEYWKKAALEKIDKLQTQADSGEILLDQSNAAYWKSSGNYLPRDVAEILLHTTFKFNYENTLLAAKKQTEKFIEDYKKRMANYKPDEEELVEMRAAFGEGATVVNVITGQRIKI